MVEAWSNSAGYPVVERPSLRIMPIGRDNRDHCFGVEPHCSVRIAVTLSQVIILLPFLIKSVKYPLHFDPSYART